MTALLVLTLFSCKDDDASLVATWRINTIADENCPDADDNETIVANADGKICEDFTGGSFCSTLTFTFTETTFTSVSTTETTLGGTTTTETETSTGTYTTDGDQITICEGGSSTCDTATFSISGNTLTIRSSEEGECDEVLKGERQ